MLNCDQLFAALDSQDTRVERHLWWIATLDFLRGDGRLVADSVQRTINWLDTLDARPEIKEKIRLSWQKVMLDLDVTLLLADFGFSPRIAFVSELASRLRNKFLPKTPDTRDGAELFELAFHHQNDGLWIAALDANTTARIAEIFSVKNKHSALNQWDADLLDAIEFNVMQIVANGFSSELRLKMETDTLLARPFHVLAKDFQNLRHLIETNKHQSDVTDQDDIVQHQDILKAVVRMREQLEACRLAIASTYLHLQDNGISLGLVYRVRQVRERIVRIRDLVDCLYGEKKRLNSQKLLSRLGALAQSLTSIRSLVKSSTSLLATKVTERSAQTGEAYITRNKSEFWQMFRRACGGGSIVSLTTVLKFVLLGLATSPFWSGLLASANYALSFILIQLLHWTLATKQPAMTAPAMAARLRDINRVDVNSEGISHEKQLVTFVDEVTHLVRSQTAAVMGNLLLVVPCVFIASVAIRFFANADLIEINKAQTILNDLSLLGLTLAFAAFTGILLFASSIIAGWTENWFVLHRIESAIAHNPRINRLLGIARCERWAIFWREHIVGFAASVSLGLLLGMVPAIAHFFGLALEVRHVTLSAGQVALAASIIGQNVLYQSNFWLALACVPLIGLFNVAVSFACALRLALTANALSNFDQRKIIAAIFARLRTNPASFIWPKS